MQESSAYFPRICTVVFLDVLRSSATKLAHLSLNCLTKFYIGLCVFIPSFRHCLGRLLDLNAAESGTNYMISSIRPKQSISGLS